MSALASTFRNTMRPFNLIKKWLYLSLKIFFSLKIENIFRTYFYRFKYRSTRGRWWETKHSHFVLNHSQTCCKLLILSACCSLSTSSNDLVNFIKGSVTYRFCPRETSYDVSRWKIVENFDSLIKVFNISKSSTQSIQNPAFS